MSEIAELATHLMKTAEDAAANGVGSYRDDAHASTAAVLRALAWHIERTMSEYDVVWPADENDLIALAIEIEAQS